MLVAFLAAVAGVERAIKGPKADRWREYLAWCLFGLCGGAFGVMVDLVTFHLSPAYFEFGKGIASAGLGDALGMGFEAGFVAGMLVGGLFLWAGGPGEGRQGTSYRRLALFLLWPIGSAVLGALVNPLLLHLDLVFSVEQLSKVLTVHQVARFVLVAQVHLGLYAGGLAGTLVGIYRIRRCSLSSSTTNQSDRSRGRAA